MPAKAVRLADRSVISVSGAEARDFLQNILTNDVRKITPERAIYAALLTPQGKYLFDFFIAERDGELLFDCEAARKDELLRKLMMYRLRAKAEIVDRSEEEAVWAIFGETEGKELLAVLDQPGACEGYKSGVLFRDPRLAAMGWRAILPAGEAPGFEEGDRESFEAHRLTQGVPDGPRDMEVDKTLALEADLDLLDGVDFEKGCYVGQELTARMKHRGKVRKRLMPVQLSGGKAEPGAEIVRDGKTVGTIRSVAGDKAIALLRLDALEASDLAAGPASVQIERPVWLDAA